jgi:hypothetical protein
MLVFAHLIDVKVIVLGVGVIGRLPFFIIPRVKLLGFFCLMFPQ